MLDPNQNNNILLVHVDLYYNSLKVVHSKLNMSLDIFRNRFKTVLKFYQTFFLNIIVK